MKWRSILLGFVIASCGGTSEPGSSEGNGPIDDLQATTGEVLNRLSLPAVDDNVRHDTLLIHNTYDLGDGTFIMAALNHHGTFEGLRLIHYRPGPDSLPVILGLSSAGYDSWIMLPTFFGPIDDMIILAELGERQSWGQKVIRFRDGSFTDLGFLDVASKEIDEASSPDSTIYKLRSIAPYCNVVKDQDGLSFSFNCDSLLLFDDLQGSYERMVPAASITYSYVNGEMLLVLDGVPIRPRASS